MGYPSKVTVGMLLDFLNEELKKGNIVRETNVVVEEYALTREETILKEREEELKYHVPDDMCDEVHTFRMGVWQCSPEGEHKSGLGENYVALSTYLRADSPFWRRLSEAHAHERTIYPTHLEEFLDEEEEDSDD